MPHLRNGERECKLPGRAGASTPAADVAGEGGWCGRGKRRASTTNKREVYWLISAYGNCMQICVVRAVQKRSHHWEGTFFIREKIVSYSRNYEWAAISLISRPDLLTNRDAKVTKSHWAWKKRYVCQGADTQLSAKRTVFFLFLLLARRTMRNFVILGPSLIMTYWM